ncbi:hypothetical protein Tco_1506279 [Tanacetum coccineum]
MMSRDCVLTIAPDEDKEIEQDEFGTHSMKEHNQLDSCTDLQGTHLMTDEGFDFTCLIREEENPLKKK